MRELLTMWADRRMVGLTLAVTATYAFLLLPFKGLSVVPGFASIRPGAAVPVVAGLLFGPAGAWGAAFGNLIGDYFGGTWNPVSPYGFLGNFLFGLAGYKLWGGLGRLSTGSPPSMASGEQFPEFVGVSLVAASLVASVIGWGGAVTGAVSFAALASVIVATDLVAAVLVGPPLLFFLYPRLRAAGLLYAQLMPEGRMVGQPEDGDGALGGYRLAAVMVAGVVLAWLVAGLVGSLVLPRTGQVALGAVALAAVVAGLAACSSAVERRDP